MTWGERFILITILVTIIYFSRVEAMEQTIAVVASDQDSKICKLVLEIDDNQQAISIVYKDTIINGKLGYREKINLNSLKNAEVVLEERNNVVILSLKSHNFDQFRGGDLVLSTIYNALKGVRKNYEIQLSKNTSGWGLYSQGRNIKELIFEANKVALIGVVGIKNLIMR